MTEISAALARYDDLFDRAYGPETSDPLTEIRDELHREIETRRAQLLAEMVGEDPRWWWARGTGPLTHPPRVR
jgi:hypothetical protein